MKNLLGGKGANPAEMCRLSTTVPSGFTISTEACTAFTEHGKEQALKLIEAEARITSRPSWADRNADGSLSFARSCASSRSRYSASCCAALCSASVVLPTWRGPSKATAACLDSACSTAGSIFR